MRTSAYLLADIMLQKSQPGGSLEDDTTTGDDAEHHEPVTQARHEAVPPDRADTLHTSIERCLCQLPEIIPHDSHNKDDHHRGPELSPTAGVGHRSSVQRRGGP